MNKRSREVMIWLSDDEYAILKSKVGRTGLSMQSYLRSLIADVQPKEKPSADFSEILKTLQHIRNNMDQVVAMVYSMGDLDAQE